MKKLALTFVACCYNEAQNIPVLLAEIEAIMESLPVDWSVLIVDDGSVDNTFEVVVEQRQQYPSLRYLSLTRNFGKEAAICAGFDHVDPSHCVVLLDADMQHPVSSVVDMIEEYRNGADMVVGIAKERATGVLDRFLSKTYHCLISKSSRHSITHGGGDFRLLSPKQLARIKRLRERGRYMKGLYSFPGGDIRTVEYDERQRANGQSEFSLFDRVGLAIDGITSMTTFPIRFFTFAGLAVLALSVCYLIFILIEILFFGRSAPGFASLLFSVVILNGLIMIQVGVQGEYIAQLLNEAKQRPIYMIDEDSSDL